VVPPPPIASSFHLKLPNSLAEVPIVYRLTILAFEQVKITENSFIEIESIFRTCT
jgi:hypothetical protein